MSNASAIDPIELGFIGLGLMGASIATRLVDQGFAVTAYDVQRAQVDALVSVGAKPAETAPDAVRAVTAICVPNGAIMRSILLDPAFEARLGEGTILLDFSTVDPEDSRFAAAHVAKFGARYVDTPISRTPDHARRGELLVMAGSTEEDAVAFAPVIAALSSDVHYCGGVGLGSTMKLVNNLCNQTILFVTIEALNFARSAGLSDDLTFGVLTRTNADNGHLRTTVRDRVLNNDFDGGFKLALAYKDIALGLAAANRVGAPMPTSGASMQAAALAIAAGNGDLDSSAYYAWLSRGTE